MLIQGEGIVNLGIESRKSLREPSGKDKNN